MSSLYGVCIAHIHEVCKQLHTHNKFKCAYDVVHVPIYTRAVYAVYSTA